MWHKLGHESTAAGHPLQTHPFPAGQEARKKVPWDWGGGKGEDAGWTEGPLALVVLRGAVWGEESWGEPACESRFASWAVLRGEVEQWLIVLS